ncbi:Gp15 family bacteriophage protein [Gracilibacillus thailandensis]|uniref:Bacteriophage Gp15 protein n=1 Tax=Gracilibacillus thailandensis TaxID=563735 RepID=A0A6N7QUE9_9BACI|nr:Gp15 family bacteriophage protein [Gracilibacillus thailandensis]MRI65164.1 hypothetical protein [Gracilibacillus thailandensis]
MRLTDYLEDTINIRGIEYKLDFTFDNILRTYELYDAEDASDAEKIVIMFDNLVINCEQPLDLEEKSMIIEKILNELVEKDTVKEQVQEEQEEENQEEVPQKKTHDLVQDADLIYASFLYDYNIDLFEQQGKLHWKKFVALLNNLSDDSIFKKVVHIRVKDIPKETKHNREEVRNLRKLKQLYSLEQKEEDAVKQIDFHMDSLAQSLKDSAKKGR